MTPMTYNGYAVRIEYSDEDRCFVGRMLGIRDMMTFHADSVVEVQCRFEESVNFYLETCKQRGDVPQKPYSGKLSLLIPPEAHARIARQAQIVGKSINQWVTETLEQAASA